MIQTTMPPSRSVLNEEELPEAREKKKKNLIPTGISLVPVAASTPVYLLLPGSPQSKQLCHLHITGADPSLPGQPQ